MKRALPLFIVLACLWFLFLASFVREAQGHDVFAAAFSSDGARKPGTYPKPAEPCTWKNRGTVKWVKDVQLDVWVRWRCVQRARDGKYRWKREEVRRTSPYRTYIRPNPTGWHRDTHFVYLPMVGGGFCGYFWPTWHYLPARLR